MFSVDIENARLASLPGGRRYRMGKRSRNISKGKYDGAKLRQLRAERGVGRPLKVTTAPTLASAVKHWGSQRAAARALGMNLSTLQRRLAKERHAA